MDTNQLSGWKKDGMIPGFIEVLENYSKRRTKNVLLSPTTFLSR
jgi:hypothetical protein